MAEPVVGKRASWAVQVGQTVSSVTQNLRRTMQGNPQMNGRSDGRKNVCGLHIRPSVFHFVRKV